MGFSPPARTEAPEHGFFHPERDGAAGLVQRMSEIMSPSPFLSKPMAAE